MFNCFYSIVIVRGFATVVQTNVYSYAFLSIFVC